MLSYRITFDRIGRTRDVPPLVVTVHDEDDLEELIAKYARKHLRSNDYEVTINTDAGTGYITCGFHIGSRFRLEAAP